MICVIDGIPSWDLAFIEERNADIQVFDISAGDEKHFVSLTEAKRYVKNHFQSEAEFFLLGQCKEPDSFLHILVDKLTYLMA